jgi:hypothetical protein
MKSRSHSLARGLHIDLVVVLSCAGVKNRATSLLPESFVAFHPLSRRPRIQKTSAIEE